MKRIGYVKINRIGCFFDQHCLPIYNIFMEQKYFVVIADIINSKKIVERGELQKTLEKTLKEVNEKKEGIVSPYTITLGDEFQAVYDKPDNIFSHIWHILEKVFPHKIRFSIGIGKITTNINRKNALGMDGEAFYLARNGIERLKEEKKVYFRINTEIPEIDLINNILKLISSLIITWKKDRYKIFNYYRTGLKVKEIAEKLENEKEKSLTERAIHKNINDGKLKEIIEIENGILDILENKDKA